MKSRAILPMSLALLGCASSSNEPQTVGNSDASSGQGSGSTSGQGSGPSSGGSGTPSSGAEAGSSSGAPGADASGFASDAAAGTNSNDAGPDASAQVDSGPVTLPDGSVNAIPAGYTGTPFKGVMAQIPGTVYARNYDVGGEGIGFHHPGATNCGDWPAGMALYRMGADCVGLSVESMQKPDVTMDGGPAMYGEIYASYCAPGEWLKFTVEVTESGTYVVGTTVGAAANLSISIAFSSTPVATTGTVMIPASVDLAQPTHEVYHVWKTVSPLGTVTLAAGIYVMTFTIVTSNANFDTFTFTKM